MFGILIKEVVDEASFIKDVLINVVDLVKDVLINVFVVRIFDLILSIIVDGIILFVVVDEKEIEFFISVEWILIIELDIMEFFEIIDIMDGEEFIKVLEAFNIVDWKVFIIVVGILVILFVKIVFILFEDSDWDNVDEVDNRWKVSLGIKISGKQ